MSSFCIVLVTRTCPLASTVDCGLSTWLSLLELILSSDEAVGSFASHSSILVERYSEEGVSPSFSLPYIVVTARNMAWRSCTCTTRLWPKTLASAFSSTSLVVYSLANSQAATMAAA